jgi:hypothetical protein
MKNLFIINEDERSRILNLHETATKGQYLNEQKPDNLMPGQPDNLLNPKSNSTTSAATPKPKNIVQSTYEKYKDKVSVGNCPSGQKFSYPLNKCVPTSSSEATAGTTEPKKTGGYGVDYIKQAQKLLGVVDDGKFGPKTLEALKTKLGVSSTTQQGQTTTVAPSTTQTTGETQQGQTTGETQQGQTTGETQQGQTTTVAPSTTQTGTDSRNADF